MIVKQFTAEGVRNCNGIRREDLMQLFEYLRDVLADRCSREDILELKQKSGGESFLGRQQFGTELERPVE